MPIPEEVQSWLDASPFTDEVKKALAKEFEDEQKAKYGRDSILSRSDYSRKMDELTNKMKAEQAEIEKQKDSLNRLQQQLAEKEPGWTKEKQNLTDKITKAQTRIYQAQQALLNKYEVSEEQLKEIFGDSSTEPLQHPQSSSAPNGGQGMPEGFDPSNYIDRQNFQASAKALVNYQNWLWKQQQEHHRMFGEYFDPDTILQRIEEDPSKTPQQVYEKEFNVADKRREIQEADIARRVEEGIQKARDEWIASQAGASIEGSYKPDQFPETHFLANREQENEPATYDVRPISADTAKAGLEIWEKMEP